jgi:hypothetical protein
MRIFLSFLICVLLISCGNNPELPDISGVRVDLKYRRFERDFFQIDSMNTRPGITNLVAQYPEFAPLFVNHVLGLGPLSDSNTLIDPGIRRFLHINQSLFETTEKTFGETNDLAEELTGAFRYLKYYFPQYPIPEILTTIGPMDALPPLSNGEPSPNYMGKDFIAIGLQFYLGKDYSIYQDPHFIANIVPVYKSRKFERAYITADVMKLVIDDLYPDSSKVQSLGEIFIEKGKRMYLLQSLLPEKHDTILYGYTNDQLKWCEENEREIYSYFLQQDLFYQHDLSLIMPYCTDGPYTQGMPQESPGNIGLFVGLKIVKSYLKKHPKINPRELMTTPASVILKKSNYKPR